MFEEKREAVTAIEAAVMPLIVKAFNVSARPTTAIVTWFNTRNEAEWSRFFLNTCQKP
jgi:hypothetical protein